MTESNGTMATGEVVKLDRGYPLVRLDDGALLRCEHAMSLVKNAGERAVIGDIVDVYLPDVHDKAMIERIHPRSCALVRKDPAERALPQVLAANFDRVLIAQPLPEVNLRRLERELVLAHETGVRVGVLLTKGDLAKSADQADEALREVRALAGPDVDVLVISRKDPQSIESVRALMPSKTTTVLMGRSGVGKSSLVNLLMGEAVQLTSDVRAVDGKGRHTTVSRTIVVLPSGGRIVDMPGVRGLGLWDADAGIGAAFADVEELAEACRFGDCKHEREPGCAVRAAVDAGELPVERYESYLALKAETREVADRRRQASWAQHEKAPESKRGSAAARKCGGSHARAGVKAGKPGKSGKAAGSGKKRGASRK